MDLLVLEKQPSRQSLPILASAPAMQNTAYAGRTGGSAQKARRRTYPLDFRLAMR
jgi:hypothetical protein